MAFHYKITDTQIVISVVGDGNMSGQAGKKAWSRKMKFLRENFEVRRGMVSTRVCHGINIKEVDMNSGGIALNYDGLITKDPRVILAVNYADCFPVVFWDIRTKLKAVAHVGIKGLANGIISSVIEKMIFLGTDLLNSYAFIGPGICQDCYEFGQEAERMFDEKYHHHLRWDGIREKYHIDIAGIIIQQMAHYDFPLENITNSCLCTFENNQLFSARRQKPKTLEELQSGVLMVGNACT
jgi:YfiH family protein